VHNDNEGGLPLVEEVELQICSDPGNGTAQSANARPVCRRSDVIFRLFRTAAARNNLSMKNWTNPLRLFFVVALAIYFGGFTFYSAFVIPILHDRLPSSLEAGRVTGRVTTALNAVGAVTLALGWCLLASLVAGRGRGDRAIPRQFWTLSISSICLGVLVALHGVLDRKLGSDALDGFYLWHRAYLWVSTVQWLANLGLLIQSARAVIPSQESRR
jgi:hypothetical protein